MNHASEQYELKYYQDQKGGWHWKVTSKGNHEVIIDTLGEQGGFASEANAKRNFELVQRALLEL